jgi:hypothetical protein
MTKRSDPAHQQRLPSFAAVAVQCSAVSPGDLGLKGVVQKDGVVSLIPIVGWVTITVFNAENHAPDWRMQPVLVNPDGFALVHPWGYPGWVGQVPKDWNLEQAKAWLTEREKQGGPAEQLVQFPQGGTFGKA